MDPISQGALGASFAQTLQSREKMVTATWLGCAAGMAPDLDVFIQSPTDPLLFLEFHRHFTHALVFIPFGALIVAGALFWLARARLNFKQAYFACLIGYATHGLLDACTTYGTQLLWPFSDVRIAWNNVSVIDPAFTLPLLLMVILAVKTRRHLYSYIGIGWVFCYLTLGFVQMERALETGRQLASTRGHTPAELSMKASFGNILIWKSIYAAEGRYYVDAVRTGLEPTFCAGDSVEQLDISRHLPQLQPDSQQARDLERFRWFSMGYLAPTGIPGEVTDMRYSTVPNEIDPMWGITIDPNKDLNTHVEWWTRRDMSGARFATFTALLRGEGCQPLAAKNITAALQ